MRPQGDTKEPGSPERPRIPPAVPSPKRRAYEAPRKALSECDSPRQFVSGYLTRLLLAFQNIFIVIHSGIRPFEHIVIGQIRSGIIDSDPPRDLKH